MNLLQLRAFDAVVRTGSFTAAAERLHVSQPAVTGHVRALEAYYEVALFRRRGRGVEPTGLGERLAEVSRRLFTLEEEAVEVLQAHEALRRGELAIAADGPYILIPLVAAFRARFPGVRVNLSIGNTRDVQAALLAERCDVTVQAHLDPDPALHAVPLATYRIVAFVGTGHRWARARRRRVALDDLAAEPLILRERGSTTRRVLETAFREAGLGPEPAIETTSRETIKEAVAAGLGAGVISEAELRPDPRLWSVSIEGAPLEYTEHVLCLERRRGLRVVREFLAVTAATARDGAVPEPGGE